MPKITLNIQTEEAAKALAHFLATQPAIEAFTDSGVPLNISVWEYVAVLLAGEAHEADSEAGILLNTKADITEFLHLKWQEAKNRARVEDVQANAGGY